LIQSETICKVTDNSGVKRIKVIRVLGRGPKKPAQIGDLVVGSAIETLPLSDIKKKTIVRAVVVRTRSSLHRKDGSSLKFDDNAVVIIDKEKLPRATRIVGPIPREIKEKGFKKISSLAEEVI
jgi:large subunit ribosomal protein L14